MKFEYLSNTELSALVDDWVKSQRDRQVMKRKLIDGITYERIAEEQELSVKQVYRIVSKWSRLLAEKII